MTFTKSKNIAESSSVKNDIATPFLPARPVLPALAAAAAAAAAAKAAAEAEAEAEAASQ